MDLTADQSRLITNFVQDWSKDSRLELETTFGVGGVVESNTFLQIAQRLRAKNFEMIPQEDRLSIITPNHIRFSLQGLGILQSYCKEDTLQDKVFSAMFKDRAFPDSNVDLKEYDIRFKMRREEDLSNDDPRVTDIINGWNTQKKAFRLIRRWSFQGKGIRIDMSMVRQTPNVPGKGEYQWSKTFLERNILLEVPRYEVEVELIHNTEYTDTPEKALKALIGGVGEVQRAIQKNSLLIRNSVIRSVRNEYQSITGSERFRGVGPVTLQIKNITTEIDEAIPNIRTGYNVTDKADGLRSMGIVTESGELYLIDQSLNVYRTGLRNKKCSKCIVDGEWVTLTKDGRAINHYLIFDIYHSDNGKPVSQLPFATFKDGILDTQAESRYNKMKEWYDLWKNDVEVIAKGITDANRLIIALKQFQFASPGDSIFKRGCSTILDTTRIYHTDGLILTSNSEPIPDRAGVRFEYQFKWKPAKDNTVDFLVIFEKDLDLPTKDKITTTIHPHSETTVQYKTMRLYVGGSKSQVSENPRATILLEEPIVKDKDTTVKYKPILFNPIDFPDTLANTCNSVIVSDPESLEEYITTEDSNEPITDRSIVEMRYDPARDPGWRWVPSRIRHDKTERLLRAISRGGNIKYSGMMNDEAVGNSVWDSIHDPITESMIRTGNEQPTEDEIKDILKVRETDIGKKYYERKAPKQNIALVKGLLDFHNKYIKNEILLKRTLRGGRKTILDLACGKGGDLFKWLFNGARMVVGIDTAGENITNPSDGAYKRYVEAIKDFGPGRTPKMVFIIGDSSKSLVDGTAGANSEERDMLRSIFGRISPEGTVPKYIQRVMAGSYRSGTDIASCMFALHYFFENTVKLNGFLQNLADTVKVGGYFIGCCFDGNKVFNLLRNTKKGHSKSGQQNDVPIWTITKEYDIEELTNDESSIGLGINVEFISIGSTHKEYLVPFELLQEKLSTIGFRLLNKNELDEIGLVNSTNTFDASYTMAEKATISQMGKKTFNMSEIVKEFSFLNRWFIFKREGETNLSEIPEMDRVNVPSGVSIPPIDLEEDDGKYMDEERTIPLPIEEKKDTDDKSLLPDPSRKFEESEIFRFGPEARQVDVLKIKDPNAGRWLGLSAPFPIPDRDRKTADGLPVMYPTIEHYLAAMKLQHASNSPELAITLMSTSGSIHQKYAVERRQKAIKSGSENPKDYELLNSEIEDVKKMMMKTSLNRLKVKFDEDKWNRPLSNTDSLSFKDRILMDALTYRWERDERFRKIVEEVRTLGKYLLYSIGTKSGDSELAGIREMTGPQKGKIKGGNKVGLFIMEISGFRF